MRRPARGLDDLATGESGQRPVHPQYVAKILDEAAAEDALFTCDVGTPTIWAARYLHMNGKRRLLGSFTHGSMANALPQAIGAQVSHPDRRPLKNLHMAKRVERRGFSGGEKPCACEKLPIHSTNAFTAAIYPDGLFGSDLLPRHRCKNR